jgi:predicted AlkP superfamily pyrophosphatase or phosphodiesterase
MDFTKSISQNQIFSIILISLVFISCTRQRVKSGNEPLPYVVMLSMDGFRWDYADRVETPNLDYIAKKGVKASYVKPVFPSKTFPNHYSMATGLYPDNHGIVDNNFTCPELGLTYRLSDRQSVENAAFYKGEPIWVTAENQGIITASYFWLGTEAAIRGVQPTHWKRYDSKVPFENRIDTVLYWLNLPLEKRPRLVTFYFHQPDSQGHDTGPHSHEIDALVIRLDSLVGDLIQKLKRLPHYNQINLIVTSDHGMTEVHPHRYIDLSEITPRQWYKLVHGGNPLFHVNTNDGMKDSVYHILKGIENIQVWRKDEIPERLNYGSNPRIGDLVILADSTWSIGWGKLSRIHYTGGAHGWDNAFKDMHTIFYAVGPAFKVNHSHRFIEVVDLYPLIAHILMIKPAEIDGKLERVIDMLK